MRAQAQTGTLIYRDFFRPIPRDTAEFKKNIKHLYGDFKGKFRDSAAIAVNQGPWAQKVPEISQINDIWVAQFD